MEVWVGHQLPTVWYSLDFSKAFDSFSHLPWRKTSHVWLAIPCLYNKWTVSFFSGHSHCWGCEFGNLRKFVKEFFSHYTFIRSGGASNGLGLKPLYPQIWPKPSKSYWTFSGLSKSITSQTSQWDAFITPRKHCNRFSRPTQTPLGELSTILRPLVGLEGNPTPFSSL